MGQSRVWLAMTPEERAAKRRVYRQRYNERNPGAENASSRKYKIANADAYGIAAAKREREKRRRNKLLVIEALGGQCAHCKGVFHPAAYDLHHLDPTKKDAIIAKILSRSWPNIQTELAKCILLCANCHRVEHAIDCGEWEQLQ